MSTFAAAAATASRGAKVVALSSITGVYAEPDLAVYGATKAADKGFAEALRHELSGTGVSVTTVFPGEVRTALHAEAEEGIGAFLEKRQPSWPR